MAALWRPSLWRSSDSTGHCVYLWVCWASNTLSSHSLCVCAQVVNMTRPAEVAGAETDARRQERFKEALLLFVLFILLTILTLRIEVIEFRDTQTALTMQRTNRGVWTCSSFTSLCWCLCHILVCVSFSWHVLVLFHLVLVVLFLIFGFSSFFCFWVGVHAPLYKNTAVFSWLLLVSLSPPARLFVLSLLC